MLPPTSGGSTGVGYNVNRHTPINSGSWSGQRGNSIWIPTDKAVLNDIHDYSEGLGRRVDGVEYRNGHADFSPVAVYTITLSRLLYNRTDESQFVDCTLDLRDKMEENARLVPTDRSLIQWFDDACKEVIGRGIAKIPGYTWHHDVYEGRIQLVPESIHSACLHVGGRSIWGGGRDNRRQRT